MLLYSFFSLSFVVSNLGIVSIICTYCKGDIDIAVNDNKEKKMINLHLTPNFFYG